MIAFGLTRLRFLLFFLFLLFSWLYLGGLDCIAIEKLALKFSFPSQKIGALFKNSSGEVLYFWGPKCELLHDAAGSFSLRTDASDLVLVCNNRALKDRSWISNLERDSIGSLCLGHTRLTDSWLNNLSSLVWLGSLHLDDTLISDDGLRELELLKNLKTLNLSKTEITGSGLHYLGKLEKLANLNLNSCHSFDAKYLSDLRSLKRLVCCGLKDIDLDDKNCVAILKLRKLKRLNLQQTRIGDRTVVSFATELPELKSLSLNNTRATGEGFKSLCKLKKLEALDFSGCSIKGQNKVTLPATLRNLFLSRTSGVDDAFIANTNMAGLTALYLDFTQISKKSLPKIGKLNQLRNLHLNGIKLESSDLTSLANLKCRVLSLNGTGISSKQLAELNREGSIVQLSQLDLSYNPLDDNAASTLAKGANLRFLSLAHTKISAAGIAQLRKALPKCRIEHEVY